MKKKEINTYSLIILILFLTIVLTMGLVSLFDTDETISQREQRTLAQYPSFTFKSFLNGQYFTQWKNAYNDTFPQREKILEDYDYLNAKLKLSISNKQEEIVDDLQQQEQQEQTGEEIDISDLVNEPFNSDGFEQFNKKSDLSGNLIYNNTGYRFFSGTNKGAKQYTDSLKLLKQYFPENNITAIIVPTSIAYCAQDKYTSDNHDQQKYLELIKKNSSGVNVLDSYQIMYNHQNEYIYYRSDHHWTALGSYYIYQQYCLDNEMVPISLDSFKKQNLGTFLGSVYNATGNNDLKSKPDTLDYYLPIVSTECTYYYDRTNLAINNQRPIFNTKASSNKYTAFIYGDNPLTVINTGASSGKSVVLIKDSYGDSLALWLANTYTTIYVIDPRHLNTTTNNMLFIKDFMADKKDADIIICNFINSATESSSFKAGMTRLLKQK